MLLDFSSRCCGFRDSDTTGGNEVCRSVFFVDVVPTLFVDMLG